MGKAPCAQTRVFLGRPGVARGSGECARITCAGRVHWGSARRVVAVVARSRSVDRYLVVSSDLPAAGAPPRLRPGARFGGRRGQPQRVRGWSAALRVVRSAHRVPGQAGDVPRAGRVGAGAHRADRGAPCAADRRPLLSALSVLRGGGLVAVFPEGTRTGGDVAAAQHGAAWLARAGGALVLPVVCRGTRAPTAPVDGCVHGSTCWWGSRCRCRRSRWAAVAPCWRRPPRPSGPCWPRWSRNSTNYGEPRECTRG